MSKIGEIMEKDKKAFESFGPREWLKYYQSLNEEKKPEECGIELSESEKKCYLESLKSLKAERKKNPGVPISYEVKYSWVE